MSEIHYCSKCEKDTKFIRKKAKTLAVVEARWYCEVCDEEIEEEFGIEALIAIEERYISRCSIAAKKAHETMKKKEANKHKKLDNFLK